jgi:hypothetical protein
MFIPKAAYTLRVQAEIAKIDSYFQIYYFPSFYYLFYIYQHTNNTYAEMLT